MVIMDERKKSDEDLTSEMHELGYPGLELVEMVQVHMAGEAQEARGHVHPGACGTDLQWKNKKL